MEELKQRILKGVCCVGDERRLGELIRNSYEIVKAKYSKKK